MKLRQTERETSKCSKIRPPNIEQVIYCSLLKIHIHEKELFCKNNKQSSHIKAPDILMHPEVQSNCKVVY